MGCERSFQDCFLAVGLGPPPPPPSDKKIWIHACIDHSTTHPRAHPMSEGTILWLCLYLGRIIHYPSRPSQGGGGGGGAEINMLVPPKSTICFPGFHVPQHFLCLLVPVKSCTYLPCSLEINAPLPCSPKSMAGPHQLPTPPTLNPLLALLYLLYFLAVPQYSLFLQG